MRADRRILQRAQFSFSILAAASFRIARRLDLHGVGAERPGPLNLNGIGIDEHRNVHADGFQALDGLADRILICQDVERSEEHTSELQSRQYLVCRLLLEKKKKTYK